MQKTKVLIVDDDLATSRLLALGLEKTGAFQVKVVNVSTNAFATGAAFQTGLDTFGRVHARRGWNARWLSKSKMTHS